MLSFMYIASGNTPNNPNYYKLINTNEETEAQRNKTTCSRSHYMTSKCWTVPQNMLLAAVLCHFWRKQWHSKWRDEKEEKKLTASLAPQWHERIEISRTAWICWQPVKNGEVLWFQASPGGCFWTVFG